MVLAELHRYLRNKRVANLMQLIQHFNVTADIMRTWLALWERKGCVRRLSLSCQGCPTPCQQEVPLQAEVYSFIE